MNFELGELDGVFHMCYKRIRAVTLPSEYKEQMILVQLSLGKVEFNGRNRVSELCNRLCLKNNMANKLDNLSSCN